MIEHSMTLSRHYKGTVVGDNLFRQKEMPTWLINPTVAKEFQLRGNTVPFQLLVDLCDKADVKRVIAESMTSYHIALAEERALGCEDCYKKGFADARKKSRKSKDTFHFED